MTQDGKRFSQRHIVDACVRVANNRGCGDAVGVLRGTLFLADEPMSMDQLVEETGYSKSTVSSNMGLLETLGLARRVVRPGDKRYFYAAVTDPDSLKKAMLLNLSAEIQLIMSALDKTEEDIRAGPKPQDATIERIASIRHFYSHIDRLLDMFSRYTTEELISLLEKEAR